MRRTLWWGSKQDELLMKDKKHWNPSEYVGSFLVSNINILGAEKWVIPTPHKIFPSCPDLQTSAVPWSPSLRDGVNDTSSIGKTRFQHLPQTPVSWDLPRKAVLMGKVIRENMKHLQAMPSEKSGYPVLSRPSWQQSACKYASSQKLYEGLGCKHLFLSSSSGHWLCGQCWVLWGGWER